MYCEAPVIGVQRLKAVPQCDQDVADSLEARRQVALPSYVGRVVRNERLLHHETLAIDGKRTRTVALGEQQVADLGATDGETAPPLDRRQLVVHVFVGDLFTSSKGCLGAGEIAGSRTYISQSKM